MSNLRSGGGISILNNFISQCNNNEHISSSRLIILVPNGFNSCGSCHDVVNIPRIFSSSIGSLLLTFILPLWLRIKGVSKVLNFSDLPIPTRIPQAMVMDWPYALYPNSPAWNLLSMYGFLFRKVKLYLFKVLVRYVDVWLPQTIEGAACLTSNYNIQKYSIIPNALSSEESKSSDYVNCESLRFYFLTHYYPHKNIERLVRSISLIKDKASFVLYLTLDENDPRVKSILQLIKDLDLSSYIINVGPVDYNSIDNFYRKVDVLVMPSLLESFSSSYIEAFRYGKPVLTSDLGFAHAVCGAAAIYFDPLDSQAIADAILSINNNPILCSNLVSAGRNQLSSFPNWDSVIYNFFEVLDDL